MLKQILADGLVSGSISGGDTSASIQAAVSCINSVPTGTVSGTVRTFTGRTTETFSFSADSPLIVATIKTDSLQSVGAFFTNVTLKNVSTNTTTTNCTLSLNATRISSNSWIGSFTIVCPNGRRLFIFGVFTGNVTVNRQVFCKPLL